MEREFSSKLIQRCQALVFKKKGIHISEDQAEMCLGKLAHLADLAFKTLVINKPNAKTYAKYNPP